MKEQTIVILKPDALARSLVGQITARLEQKGLQLVGCKMTVLTRDVLDLHYAHLVKKPFYPRIAAFMSSLPVVVQCWAGLDAVRIVREMTGVTNGREARSGTIRGDFSMSVQCNLVHASDSTEAAALEVDRFFKSGELFDYSMPTLDYLLAADEQ